MLVLVWTNLRVTLVLSTWGTPKARVRHRQPKLLHALRPEQLRSLYWMVQQDTGLQVESPRNLQRTDPSERIPKKKKKKTWVPSWEVTLSPTLWHFWRWFNWAVTGFVLLEELAFWTCGITMFISSLELRKSWLFRVCTSLYSPVI